MGFLEGLTLLFVICKILGIITWAWWLVLIPEVIAFALYGAWFIIFGSMFHSASKEFF